MYIADDDIDVLRLECGCIGFLYDLSDILRLLIILLPDLITASAINDESQ